MSLDIRYLNIRTFISTVYMETQSVDSPQTSSGRGRGRGKSRGGLGKYLRARGRGRGRGRPAEFGKRLVLEDEEEVELDPNSEEAIEAQEFQHKFSRRQLGSNADRYAEPEPVLNSDGTSSFCEFVSFDLTSYDIPLLGEEEVEPEVDLSSFLERQRISDATSPGPSSALPPPHDEEIDESLAHISSKPPKRVSQSKKGRVQTVEWDEELDEMTREKAAAEATWGMLCISTYA